MSKSTLLLEAAREMESAISCLRRAKRLLMDAHNSQHLPVAMDLVRLEESLLILRDPECTPEYYDRR